MSPASDAISEAMLALNSLNSSINSARGETLSPTGPGLELASLCLLLTGALPSAILYAHYEHNYVGFWLCNLGPKQGLAVITAIPSTLDAFD
jgi:hypothetical protein